MATATANASPTYFANFNAVTTSKVRLITHGQTARLFELEVYATVTNPLLRVNVALSRPVTFSDRRNLGEEGDKAVDGHRGSSNSANTHWVTNDGNHWLEITLAGTVAVNGFQIWTGSDGYKEPLVVFRFMLLKEDGTWQTLISATNNSDPLYAAKFEPVTATKVRLEIDRQTVRLFELEVYSTMKLFD